MDKISSAEAIFKLCSYQHLGSITNYRSNFDLLFGEKFNAKKYSQLLKAYNDNQISSAIHARVSGRRFKGKNNNLEVLNKILFDAYALKSGTSSYTIPQAGGLGVMGLVILIRRTNSWKLYKYNPHTYQLIDQYENITNIDELFYTKSVDFINADCCIIITCELKKLAKQYLTRAYKFACIQSGHIAQNISLRATHLEINSVTLGSLIENTIIDRCLLLPSCYPLYAVIIG